MSKPSLITVLAEDQRHQNLARRYLKQAGYGQHAIRYADLPVGRGCGEQWVRAHYPAEVKAYRQRSARAETALVVIIDADNGDLDRRLQQLSAALAASGVEARDHAERIVHWIPRRNVETWILCLSGQAVDEEVDYRHTKGIDALIGLAAETFFLWTRPQAQIPSGCVHSLRAAAIESARI